MSKTNVIEWVNPGPEDILWVYPYEDIRWGSVLVVHEYETAVFMRDGKIYDVLPPGRHVLTTQNLPLLTRAFRLVAGYGETPFKARIIFVSLKQFRGKFGLSTRVKLGPRTLYMTELQSFGEFWYRVADPVLFLTQVAGAVRELSSTVVADFIRNYFVETLIQEISKYSAIDIYTNLTQVTSRLKAGTIQEAFAQRGLELIDVKIAGITLPQLERMEKEDPTYGLPLLLAIQKGDEDKVLEIVKTVEVMRALGKSPAAGWMGALVAMPTLMQQAIQPTQPQQPQQAPPQPAPTPAQPQESPLVAKLRELKKMLDEGLITQEEYDQLKKELLEKYKKEM
ncbi:SPFH domain-containing protein [Thermosphaera chiliense]|uniref:SPFH domain-containing protein n=1 Tax=Thermosphaera chiliense TaxID=3402707 RepID=A0A7M1URL6_9CREN|nr:SPFH domain-containing protein [Thermosphaera aggregans]QOR94831.1 SPFH domain-containing protein [Thermosphaera aggregans]